MFGGFAIQVLIEDTSTILLDSPLPDTGAPCNFLGEVRAFDFSRVIIQEALLSAVTLAGNATLVHLGAIHGIVASGRRRGR